MESEERTPPSKDLDRDPEFACWKSSKVKGRGQRGRRRRPQVPGTLLSSTRLLDNDGEWDIQEFTSNINNGARFSVCINNEQVTEAAFLSDTTTACAGKTITLEKWGILPKFQRTTPGTGFGRKALLKVCELYRLAGASTMDIPSPNEKGILSYQSAGFVWLPEHIALRKVLNSPLEDAEWSVRTAPCLFDHSDDSDSSSEKGIANKEVPVEEIFDLTQQVPLPDIIPRLSNTDHLLKATPARLMEEVNSLCTSKTKGRQTGDDGLQQARRRVVRTGSQPGLAQRTGATFQGIVNSINASTYWVSILCHYSIS